MGTYSAFETDKNIEADEGVTLDYGKGGKFFIHRAGGSNQKFKNYAQAVMKPYTRQLQQNTLDEQVATDLSVDIYAKTVIKGWEGVTDRAGNELPYTYENCKALMKDLPELFGDIQKAATDASLFRKQVIEDVVGN